MAYLYIDRKKSGKYISICQNFRDEKGTSRRKTIAKLGNADNYTPDMLKSIGRKLYEMGGGNIIELFKSQLKEINRQNYGFPFILEKLFKIYQLDFFFEKISEDNNLKYSIYDALRLMISDRWYDPLSKLKTYQTQAEYTGLENVKLQNLYRALDKLDKYQEQIEKHIFNINSNLFNQKLDIVFYDVTTLYFESAIVNESSVRQLGFSKEGRIGTTQVVLGLMIDQNQMPVGYRVYKGNQYEGHTFLDAVNDLKQRYEIEKIIIVTDSAMMSKKNTDYVNSPEFGYEFIIGERLKSLPDSVKNHFLDRMNYKTLIIKESGKDIPIEYCTIKHENKTIIITYSKSRETKDRYERENLLRKAEKFLQSPSNINRKATRHYLKQVGKNKYELDLERIKESEQFDGLLGVSTNQKEFKPEEVLKQYKQLYTIEQSFRTFKSYFEIRPIYHWTDKRINGHICMCYIAYTLLRALQTKLKEKKIEISETEIRKILTKMEVSLLKQDSEYIYIRSNAEPKAEQLLSNLGLKLPPDVFLKSEINTYL